MATNNPYAWDQAAHAARLTKELAAKGVTVQPGQPVQTRRPPQDTRAAMARYVQGHQGQPIQYSQEQMIARGARPTPGPSRPSAPPVAPRPPMGQRPPVTPPTSPPQNIYRPPMGGRPPIGPSAPQPYRYDPLSSSAYRYQTTYHDHPWYDPLSSAYQSANQWQEELWQEPEPIRPTTDPRTWFPWLPDLWSLR